MFLNFDDIDQGADQGKPTREEIETLCLLHATGKGASTFAQLAARLGLTPALGPTIKVAVESLVSAGWLALGEERVWRTDEGAAHLAARLDALGVPG